MKPTKATAAPKKKQPAPVEAGRLPGETYHITDRLTHEQQKEQFLDLIMSDREVVRAILGGIACDDTHATFIDGSLEDVVADMHALRIAISGEEADAYHADIAGAFYHLSRRIEAIAAVATKIAQSGVSK